MVDGLTPPLDDGSRRLIESSIVGIILGELGGDIFDANRHFLTLTGYERSDLPLRWHEILRSERPELDTRRSLELLEHGEVSPWNVEVRVKDSRPLPALVSATRLGDTGPECVGFVLDLSQIKEAEAALELGRARYKVLFEQSPSLSVTVDRNGTIVSVNVHGARKLGFEKSELVGKPVFSLVDQRDQTGLAEQIEYAANHPGKVASRDLRHPCKDGSILWTRGSLRSIPQVEGEERYLLVCKDVTEHKTTEQRLLGYQERLRVLTSDLVLAEEKERRRISTVLHDDVGHSLALAQIRLGKMEQESAGGAHSDLAPVRELVREAIETTRRLTFELSSPVLYELGLTAALESAVDRLAAATGIHFHCVAEGQVRPLSEDVSVLLFRSVRELLLNAAKHALAQEVRVELQTVEDELLIRVSDDGVGFDVAKVLRPAGTGLGHGLLSAAEQIQSLGGTLEIDAAPGRGTRCLINLPLEPGATGGSEADCANPRIG